MKPQFPRIVGCLHENGQVFLGGNADLGFQKNFLSIELGFLTFFKDL